MSKLIRACGRIVWPAVAITTLALLFGAQPSAHASPLAQDATVSIVPATDTVECGSNTTLEVLIDNVDADTLYGVDFRISYDPAVAEVVDANPAAPGVQIQQGSYPDVSGGRGLVQVNSVDVGTGTVSYAATLVNPTPPESGTSGVAAQITFRGVAAGSTDINFTSVLLSDQPARPIPVSPQDGELSVTCDGGSTPEPTEDPGGPTATPVPGQPTATPVPTDVPDGGDCTHVVKPGETLYSIANTYGTTVDAIMKANNIKNPDQIYAGQTLVIPGCNVGGATPVPPIEPPPGETCSHVVKPGETLYSIANYYGTTVAAIMAANGLSNPDLIIAGQTLVIPGCGGSPKPPPSGGDCFTYVVKPGDTVSSIAIRYGDTIHGITHRNKLVNPNTIYAGQRLAICPGGGIGQPVPPIEPPVYPPPGKCRYTHIVKPGETLSGIAFAYGTPWYMIARVNNLANPNLIYAGQTLCIP